jgi:hypothetical protein
MVDIKQSALDAWATFQHAAETLKQNILITAGETKETASAATKAAIDKIDDALQVIKDRLPK